MNAGDSHASQLLGTKLEDQSGYYPFTYEGYRTLPDLTPDCTVISVRPVMCLLPFKSSPFPCLLRETGALGRLC